LTQGSLTQGRTPRTRPQVGPRSYAPILSFPFQPGVGQRLPRRERVDCLLPYRGLKQVRTRSRRSGSSSGRAPATEGKSSTAPDCRRFSAIRGHRRPWPRWDTTLAVDAPQATLRLARCPRCQTVFAICRRCDRGHVYCSPRCSAEGRSESLRRARRRHRMSSEGRLDHRDRERDRRRRRRCEAARVGDHPSATGPSSGKVEQRSVAARTVVPSHGTPSTDSNAEEVQPHGLASITTTTAPIPPGVDETQRLLHCARCHVSATRFVRSRIERGVGTRAGPR